MLVAASAAPTLTALVVIAVETISALGTGTSMFRTGIWTLVTSVDIGGIFGGLGCGGSSFVSWDFFAFGVSTDAGGGVAGNTMTS